MTAVMLRIAVSAWHAEDVCQGVDGGEAAVRTRTALEPDTKSDYLLCLFLYTQSH